MAGGLTQFAPKYRVIAEELRQRIEVNQYGPNQIFPSETELIQQFHVSRPTIRSALEVLVRDRLLDRRKGKGTFVTAAYGGGIKVTTLIFVYPNIVSLTYPYLSRLYRSFGEAVCDYTKSSGNEVNVQCIAVGKDSEGSYSILHAKDAFYSNIFNPSFTQGLCLTIAIPTQEIRELEDQGIACVVVGGQKNKNLRNYVPAVTFDPLVAIKIGFAHLRQLGHRNIGIMGTNGFLLDIQRRYEAELTEEERVVLNDEYNSSSVFYDRKSAFEATLELLKRPNRPTALYCEDDVIAVGARDAAYKLGLSVPADLSIVGTGDFMPDAGITSITIPVKKMARVAVEVLIGIIFDCPGNPQDFGMDDCKLIVRESSGKAPCR